MMMIVESGSWRLDTMPSLAPLQNEEEEEEKV
jgi:hypothetical protein